MARSFNGTSDFINAGSGSATNIAGTLTYSCWANAASLPVSGGGGLAIIMGRGFAAGIQQAALGYIGNNIGTGVGPGPFLAITYYDGSNHGMQWKTTNTINTWHHIVGGWDGSTWFLYNDNVNVGNSDTTTQVAPTADAGANFEIGSEDISGTASRFFNGSVDDVACWNVALSLGEISALFQGARPNTIRPTALKGYWPLYGLSSPEPDLSGNLNNGTLTGTALAAGAPIMQFTPRWPQFLVPPPSSILWAQSVM